MINVVVDLFHGDPVSGFETVKAAGIAGIIHKATQGLSFQDPTYHDRRTQALAAGLLWGAYHFGEGGDGAQQAQAFLSYVQPEAGDLLVLDFETNTQGASMSLAEAEQFVTAVHSATGRWPGLYSSPSYLSQALGHGTSPTLASCWLWIADYASAPVVPANWPYWTLWQYTDGTHGPEPHTVDGIGNCDRDQFNGSLEQLQKLWGVAAT